MFNWKKSLLSVFMITLLSGLAFSASQPVVAELITATW